jgi:cytidylate kinase
VVDALAALATGAMYRACTLRALRLGVDLGDAQALAQVVEDAKIELTELTCGSGLKVVLDGEDVTAAIRDPDVTQAIHHLANCGPVRERLVAQQQALAARSERWVVAEGRDLASVVYPDADVKVYLDASVEVRAGRRLRDLGEEAPSLEELQAQIEARDASDRGREVGPLVQVPDATVLDTSDLTLEQVVDALAALATGAAASASGDGPGA